MTATDTPSQTTDSYWLQAERKNGAYPTHTPNGGKWLIFVSSSEVDALWDTIRRATEDGQLGGYAKVSTALQNPNANSPDKVICVYTYDCTDETDVKRIREELRHLGITSEIRYKTDQETKAGIYSKRGNKNIQKYRM
jgi:hypothetical protein